MNNRILSFISAAISCGMLSLCLVSCSDEKEPGIPEIGYESFADANPFDIYKSGFVDIANGVFYEGRDGEASFTRTIDTDSAESITLTYEFKTALLTAGRWRSGNGERVGYETSNIILPKVSYITYEGLTWEYRAVVTEVDEVDFDLELSEYGEYESWNRDSVSAKRVTIYPYSGIYPLESISCSHYYASDQPTPQCGVSVYPVRYDREHRKVKALRKIVIRMTKEDI